jgi:hypothetical protein
VGSQHVAAGQSLVREMDLSYDPDTPRKSRPIASSPFMASTGAYPVPGLRAPAPPPDPGMRIPTPMGWLTPGMAAHMLNNLAPSREALADTLGVPMDGMAWVARQLGAKGIPGGMGEADPLTQAISNLTGTAGSVPQQMWKPGPDVPLSSENIRRLLGQYIPKGGMF